jgi:hypothetical protein
VRSGAKRTVSVASGVLAVSAVALLAVPGAAFAIDVPATATVGLGSLSMATPASVGFTASLTGVNQTAHTNDPLDIIDARGSGVGWNVTLTSTQFVTATLPVKSLPLTSLTDGITPSAAPVGVCDTSVTCTLADNTSLAPYIIAIPAGVTVAPTAVKVQTAAAGTGLGGQTWTHIMSLFLPGNTQAGAYSSTWTYSFVSAP